MRRVLFFFALLITATANAQLYIESGALVTVQTGGTIVVTGDVVSNASIKGGGTLIMNGTALQTLSMNGDTISKLQINNAANVVLGIGTAVIDSNLSFANGKLSLANSDLVLSPSATVTGMGANSFVSTDGTGNLKKMITADVSNFMLPVGETNNYHPVYITTAGSTYSNAFISVKSINGSSVSSPPMIANHLNAYWPIRDSGITGGTVSVTGQYTTADIAGTEANLVGYFYNGTDWSSAGETHSASLHQVSAPVSGSSGILYSMNKFVAVGARAFLQAPYNSSTGLMSDALRSGSNIIPTTDPYRSTPYNAFFSHVNNSITETASASVFNDQASVNNNIVDWVFLELRNTTVSPGNTVLQTRSALIQRDGDIVDVDGVSPVTFNNVADGNYILAIRHRNHLGLSLDPATSAKSFSEKSSVAYTTNVADFRLAATPSYGNANSHATATHPTLTNVKLLWAGNASMNGNTKWAGLQNDKDYLFITALGSNPAGVLSNVYSPADINMNRSVRFNGLSNDKDYLYVTVLGSQTTAQRLQSLPN